MIRILYVIILTIAFSAKAKAQNSFIQVVADPGISVFLNGEFKGITNDELGGLIIEKLSSGTYTIKVVKEGFKPQEEIITVKSGEVLRYQVMHFKPNIQIRQQVTKISRH